MNVKLIKENGKYQFSMLNEDIAAVKKNYPTISDEDFDTIIALDPTFKQGKDSVGTYGKWLLNLFRKNVISKNDFGHIPDLLTRFDSEKKSLKNKDIGSYKTLKDVEDALNDAEPQQLTHRQEVRQNQKARKNADLLNEADLVFEDGDWEVWVPKTYAASCKLGQGSSWCTASTESDYYYNYYTSRGDLYILINKHNPNEKYQFHFETNSFMDADDSSIDFISLVGQYDDLLEFFKPKILDAIGWESSSDNPNEMEVDIDRDALARDIAYTNDFDYKFVDDVLCCDAFSYFFGSYYDENLSDDEVNYAIDAINEENMQLISDISDSTINSKEELKNSDDVDIYDAIRFAMASSCDLANESKCLSDFNKALEKAGIKSKNGEYLLSDENDLYATLSLNTVFDNLDEIYDYTDINEWFLENCISVDIDEPQYGWAGEFNEEVFNDELANKLYDLK